jgi:putative aldouronate transport system permease protein
MRELQSRGEKRFSLFAEIVIIILVIISVAPLLLMFIASITKESVLIANGYSFFPKAFSLDAYHYIRSEANTILRAYGVSILVTSLGTFASIIMTSMLAYPLSRKDFKYRNIIAFIVFFTMLFSGGIAPSYIMWTRVFHIKNYYRNNIPDSLIESAQIDGAGELKIFFKIMLPLSVPVVATIGLFTGLAYWNDWINALYYITKPQLYGIQNLLSIIMNNISFLQSGSSSATVGAVAIQLPSTAVRMALAVIGILPIVIIFPFIQKYFIKGIVVGAVKG